MKEIKEICGENPKQVEVVFVPDEDVGAVINCFGAMKVVEPDDHPLKRKFPSKETPKKYSTPSKTKPTPSKMFTTKSGRKVTNKFKNLNVNFLVENNEKDGGEEEESTSSDESDENEQREYVKPSALYDDDNELGKQLFGFQTPRKKDTMLQKATYSASRNAKGQNTPSKSDSNSVPKTPHATRTKIKKRIAEEASRQKLDKMLEESESDYFPSTDSSESEDSESENEYTVLSEQQIRSNATTTIPSTNRRTRGEMNQNFMFTSDDYFESQNSRSITSNHTLRKLKTPKFQQDQLTALLKAINPTHQKAIVDLEQSNRSMYKRWLYAMSEGFNILVYGIGSKKELLNDFRREFLNNAFSVVVNGFFPGFSIKELLECIAVQAFDIKTLPTQYHEIVETIEMKQKSPYTNRVFVIINNLDGIIMRCDKTQSVLAQLAAIPKIHMIASVDHINSPLLWDQSKLSKLNFIWEDATTFLPYTEETSFESSMMVQRSGVIALSALKNVFQSLTRNTREVFKKILKHQLENGGKQYQGMLFSELYRTCRDGFIVSSDLALRTQLTEFIDHQLVKWKKDTDHLIIPLDNTLLKQFQNEIME